MWDNLKIYRYYDSIIKKFLLFSGLMPIKNSWIYYRFLPYVHGIAMILMTCGIFNFSYDHRKNLGLFFKVFTLAVSSLTCVQKMISFVWYRKRMVDLWDNLATTFGTDFEDEKLRPVLMSPISPFFRFSLGMGLVGIVVASIYCVKPGISVVIQYAGRGRIVRFVLPFPSSQPWTIGESLWVYWCQYAFEVYIGACLFIINTTVDTLFGYFIFQISGQLRTLSHRMRHLDAKENHRKVISECVDRYRILIKCREHLEYIYGPIVLWMVLTNSLAICSLMYQAAHMGPKKAFHVALYLILKGFQIFVYGSFGTILTSENDTFREAIYVSDWAGSGQKTLMTNILTMILCNKPFQLRACSVTTISVEMFVTVMNTATSYYLMVRTVEEGNK